MKWVKWPLIAISLLAAIAIAQRIYYIPLLPDRVGSEDKRDWVSGTAQLWIIGIIFFLLAALWAIFVRFFPIRFPPFPDRRYWPANSENRERVSRIWLNHYMWMFAAAIGFGIGMTQMVLQQDGPSARFLGLATALTFIVFGLVRFRMIFRRLTREAEAPRGSP